MDEKWRFEAGLKLQGQLKPEMEAGFLTEIRGHFPRTPQERIILCGEASGSAHWKVEGIHARQVMAKEQGCWKQRTISSRLSSEGLDPTSAYWVE